MPKKYYYDRCYNTIFHADKSIGARGCGNLSDTDSTYSLEMYRLIAKLFLELVISYYE